jgi:predicted NodU family carbamoyl transferase
MFLQFSRVCLPVFLSVCLSAFATPPSSFFIPQAREWYRPVAPVLAAEETDRAFARDNPAQPLHSPFMSFAPRATLAASQRLPALAHVDGSARPQTVQTCRSPAPSRFFFLLSCSCFKRRTSASVHMSFARPRIFFS